MRAHEHKTLDCPVCSAEKAVDMNIAHRAGTKIKNVTCVNGHRFAVIYGGRSGLRVYGVFESA